MLLLLLLVGGAIVNVAVAWGCAIWSKPSSAMGSPSFAHELVWWHENIPPGFPSQPLEVYGARTWGTDYAMILGIDSRIGAMSYEAFHWTSGWPTRSLERSHWRNLDEGKRWLRHSLVLGESGGSPRTLPLRPIWPGFAINTVFYAAILWGGWMLFAAPFALRRWRRIKRGLCPACGYQVGTSAVCTECGKELKQSRA